MPYRPARTSRDRTRLGNLTRAIKMSQFTNDFATLNRLRRAPIPNTTLFVHCASNFT